MSKQAKATTSANRQDFGRQILHCGFGAALCVALGACGVKETRNAMDPDMVRAVSDERALAKQMAAAETNPVPSDVWKFFELIEGNNLKEATNVYERLRRESAYESNQGAVSGLVSLLFGGSSAPPPSALHDALWCPILETVGIVDSFNDWDGELLHRFGRDIMDSIPTNSIYFGGTDPGRFVITALCQSYRDAKPFFVLTQNALVDGRYLDYLQEIYGARMHVPSASDSKVAFSNYLSDARQRLDAGKLKPGEDVRVVEGRVQATGQIAVMGINGLLVKYIFDHNPSQAFYIEESFPVDWMYPYLTPNGLIMKLNREPFPELPGTVVSADHDYWHRYTGQLIGEWLGDETSVKEVCDFGNRVYLNQDLGGFTGDQAFARNKMAQKSFSKLRSSIGGVYVWRYEHLGSADEKARMSKEADYAFRQAVALCPYSPEAVFRYVNFLCMQKRTQDALLVARLCRRLDPENTQVAQLVEAIQKLP